MMGENQLALQSTLDLLTLRLKKSGNYNQEKVEHFCHVMTEKDYTNFQQKLDAYTQYEMQMQPNMARMNFLSSATSVTQFSPVSFRAPVPVPVLGGSKLEDCEAGLEGLWTTVSLDKDEKLHTKSPYGTKRLLFKINDVCEKFGHCSLKDVWALFFERTYPIVSSGFWPINQYIRLVLVNKSTHHMEHDWCRNNLLHLNLFDNHFFEFDGAGGAYTLKCKTTRRCRVCELPVTKPDPSVNGCKCPCRCCDKQLSECKQRRYYTRLKLYTEVFVVGGISYPHTGMFETADIKDTGKGSGIQDGIPAPKVASCDSFFAL